MFWSNPPLLLFSLNGEDELVMRLTPILQLYLQVRVFGLNSIRDLVRFLLGYICSVKKGNQFILVSLNFVE